jgi:hypothetical protein
MLFGVEAPAVSPTTKEPADGSHPRVTVSGLDVVDGAPTGLWRTASRETRQDGSAM